MADPDQDPPPTVRKPSSPASAAAEVTPYSPTPRGSDPRDTAGWVSALKSMHFSVEIQNLLDDNLLLNLPRVELDTHKVPVLGGILLLARLGHGGMGSVYYGVKPLLRQEVAVKVMPRDIAEKGPELITRFIQEAQIAAHIESPHLIHVTDVNQDGGLFFLVMEYVNGISAGALVREQRAQNAEIDERAALDICIAATTGLAAAHAQGIVHRDIKPDNILIPQTRGWTLEYAKAKLADLGLARDQALAAHALTGVLDTMGTPGFIAPEQARSAHLAGKPADVFGMGATLYSLLAKQTPFKGESATDTLLKTVNERHTPIQALRPNVSSVTAELLDRCLEKEPVNRFADAAVLLEALKICRDNLLTPSVSKRKAIEQLNVLRNAPEKGLKAAPEQVTTVMLPPPYQSARRPRHLAAAMFGIALTLGGALWLWHVLTAEVVNVGVACSTEKTLWLKWAAAEFNKRPEGRNSKVEIYTLGSQGGADALLACDTRIQVWTPSSQTRVDDFVQKWKARYNKDPILKEQSVTLTPLVFLIWKDRDEAFRTKYSELSFTTLRQSLEEKGGWQAIAGHPEWGRVEFAFVDPLKFDGGLGLLISMAYEFNNKARNLTVADIRRPEFKEFLTAIAKNSSIGSASQGTDPLLKQMIVKGPSNYEVMIVFENLALQRLTEGENRWGPLRIEYPPRNLWLETPYIILDAPWSSTAQRTAAEAFLNFLLGETAQKEALRQGFRPVNPAVPMRFPESPFEKYASYGVKLEVPMICEPPSPDVVEALQVLWQEVRSGK